MCGLEVVICKATSTGGVGYEGDKKVADYQCYNSGGHCVVRAPSNSKDVFGVELRTTYDSLNGGAMDYPVGTNSFEVDPDSWWDRNIKYNNRFIEELRKVQKAKQKEE